jgi:hypothetical protein
MDGAFDIATGLYTIPKFAKPKTDYRCPDEKCGQHVFLRAGEKNRHHFSHYPNSNCKFYDGTGESYAHSTAKFVMANLLRTGLVEFRDTLRCCGKTTIFTTDNRNIDKVLIETRRPYGIPDIICVLKDGTEIIVEILHTHKTSASNRIGTWFEVRAMDVIENHQDAKFECIRYERCAECVAENERKHLEWLARREAERQEECKRQENYAAQLRISRLKDRKRQEEFETRKAIEEAEAEERRLKNLERERERMKQMETEQFKQQQERMRLAEIQRHEEALIRDQIRREEMIKYEEQKRITLIRIQEEKERARQYLKHYNSVHEEFMREVVDKYVYDPDARPETESVIYKDCDFLHPHHIIRFRHLKNKSNPLTNAEA